MFPGLGVGWPVPPCVFVEHLLGGVVGCIERWRLLRLRNVITMGEVDSSIVKALLCGVVVLVKLKLLVC